MSPGQEKIVENIINDIIDIVRENIINEKYVFCQFSITVIFKEEICNLVLTSFRRL